MIGVTSCGNAKFIGAGLKCREKRLGSRNCGSTEDCRALYVYQMNVKNPTPYIYIYIYIYPAVITSSLSIVIYIVLIYRGTCVIDIIVRNDIYIVTQIIS